MLLNLIYRFFKTQYGKVLPKKNYIENIITLVKDIHNLFLNWCLLQKGEGRPSYMEDTRVITQDTLRVEQVTQKRILNQRVVPKIGP